MAKRQPRSFTPPKKTVRVAEPEKKGREKVVAVSVTEVEEEPERRGMPIEDVLVLITTLGLIVGIFIGISALGKHYSAGPMSSSYKAPAKGDVVDPGTVKLMTSNLK